MDCVVLDLIIDSVLGNSNILCLEDEVILLCEVPIPFSILKIGILWGLRLGFLTSKIGVLWPLLFNKGLLSSVNIGYFFELTDLFSIDLDKLTTTGSTSTCTSCTFRMGLSSLSSGWDGFESGVTAFGVTLLSMISFSSLLLTVKGLNGMSGSDDLDSSNGDITGREGGTVTWWATGCLWRTDG